MQGWNIHFLKFEDLIKSIVKEVIELSQSYNNIAYSL